MHLVMSFIASKEQCIFRTMPWRTTFWMACSDDSSFPVRVWIFRSWRKFLMKITSLPLRPFSTFFLRIPYFHMVSKTFWRSKNIVKSVCFFLNAYWIRFPNLVGSYRLIDVYENQPGVSIIHNFLLGSEVREKQRFFSIAFRWRVLGRLVCSYFYQGGLYLVWV